MKNINGDENILGCCYTLPGKRQINVNSVGETPAYSATKRSIMKS